MPTLFPIRNLYYLSSLQRFLLVKTNAELSAHLEFLRNFGNINLKQNRIT